MAEIIVTGGTFDKDYNPRTGEVGFLEHESSVSDILSKARAMGHHVRIAMLIDSLDMTDEHREALAELCLNADDDSVVVTHGTDTMTQTATFLEQFSIDKKVVLTGAMRPHRLGDSDAAFNLGFALAASKLLDNGVYVAMNADIFLAGTVQKNRQTLQFERVD